MTTYADSYQREDAAPDFHAQIMTIEQTLAQADPQMAQTLTDEAGIWLGSLYEEAERGDAYTNTAEGYFSQLKRSIDGTHHHVGSGHLHRYLAEFDYRYNTRKWSDRQRTVKAIQMVAGKRLMYRDPIGKKSE